MKRRKVLPSLAPATTIARHLSLLEYYHACTGISRHTLEQPREIVLVMEGQGIIDSAVWRTALAAVIRVQPCCRLHLIGDGLRARWASDGEATRLREITECRWDGRSQHGAELITATPLLLRGGPTSELIVAHGPPPRIILRGLHAAVDGMGIVLLMRELFRALRNEPLMGCNATFSDVDLMLAIDAAKRNGNTSIPACLTGGAQGDEFGDVWRRLSLPPLKINLLGCVAAACAEFSYRYSSLPVRIAVPSDLAVTIAAYTRR